MTTASEIKKTLNAHFKGQKIKFSVTTRRVSCAHEISVEWVGGAFENEVWEVVKGFHTLVDKSDGMTDYFFMSGVNVKLKRRYDDADIEFLTHCFNSVACSNEEIVVEQYTDKIGGYYISFNRDGYWLSYCNHPHHLIVFRQYNKTGAISEDACIPEVVEETNECDLLNGDEVDQTKPYVIIHWAEGVQVYNRDAKFASFASAHQALLNIYNANSDDWDKCYIKTKFSVIYPDGETYEGRLDMSPREDDPTKTDNLIKTHCMNYLDWAVEEDRKNQADVNVWLAKYGFDDNKTQQDNEILKAKEELLEVMKQMKEYLDIQIEILMNFEPEKQPERLQSLDQEFGIELLKRRKDKLQKRIMAHR